MTKVSDLFAEEIRLAVGKALREQKIETAKLLLDVLSPEVIAKAIGLDIEDVRHIMEDDLLSKRVDFD